MPAVVEGRLIFLFLNLLSNCSVLTERRKRRLLLPKVVEDHDVCVHVEEVVAVGWVVVCCPLFWLWAPEGELVTAVFGLIVHTVKAGNLNIQKGKRVFLFHCSTD